MHTSINRGPTCHLCHVQLVYQKPFQTGDVELVTCALYINLTVVACMTYWSVTAEETYSLEKAVLSETI
jgi:hypothetical protein